MDVLGDLLGQAAWLRLDLLGRLLLATLLGGAIGFEREHSGKPAGLRTNILICLGATLITDLSVAFPGFVPNEFVRADPARLAAQIVSGIGFLGAGTIIQARGSVTGLTTAATLWVVAAIGIGVGTGSYVEAAGATLLVLVVLVILGRLELRVLEHRSRRSFRLILEGETGVVNRATEFMEDAGLSVVLEGVDHDRSRGAWIATFEAQGPESLFRQVRSDLLDRDEVRGFNLV
ncbi:MAG: MgtC/SapB family protein [Longimicrobiales bacterium]|nr:MgtC/SapB family protein [Longimicrobiales bacterium]